MNTKPCTIELIDKEGDVAYARDFDTIKEAKEFMKETGRDRSYWLQFSESEDFVKSIDRIDLVRDGELLLHWYVEW